MKKKITEVVNDDSSETIFYMNQSDISRHIGPGADGHSSTVTNMKNRRAHNLSTKSKKQKNHDMNKNNFSVGFTTSLPLTFNGEEEDEHDGLGVVVTNSRRNSQAAGSRLSNLVRLMDETSKLIQPSE